MKINATEWIDHEDKAVRGNRIERLEWLLVNYPNSPNGFMVPGGLLSINLLEEIKYCFVYGQYLSVAVLGLAFIERIFASKFFGEGRNDLVRAGCQDLLREAFEHNLLSKEEFEQFDHIRVLRNPIVHFKRPFSKESLEYRTIQENLGLDEIIETDAKEILLAVLSVLNKLNPEGSIWARPLY